ncbi:hypothetical protein [Coleofasciculus sp. A1-SPW-01]|uniref:hypothetical protein n=1 Tax=Coleofasciculus sp. A1-SPW-01 TaxID=3070819 RepID=UPI0040642764
MSDWFCSIFGRIRWDFMGGVDLADFGVSAQSNAETQSLYGFLSELFPNTLPRKGMETDSELVIDCPYECFPNTLPRKGMETLGVAL